MIIKQAVWPESTGTVHLMNEQYLYKPSNSPQSSFFWHRDADTILEKIVDPDPEYHAFQQTLHQPQKNYVSVNYADNTNPKATSISTTAKKSISAAAIENSQTSVNIKNSLTAAPRCSDAHLQTMRQKHARVSDFPYVNVWIPLDVVDETNGTLQILTVHSPGHTTR